VRCGNCGLERDGHRESCECVPAWVWRDPEVVAAVRGRDAQRVIQFLRRRVKNLSQESLARMCGVAQSTINRAESGKGTDPRKAVEALHGLGAPEPEPTDEAVPPAAASLAGSRFSDHTAVAEKTGAGWGQRIALLGSLVSRYDLPEDGRVRSLGKLQREVGTIIRCRLNSHYSCLMERLPELLSELTRALSTYRGQERAHAARLLVQAYRAADAVADKFGLHDLSARTIQVFLWAADQTGDDVTRAAATYVRGETFFCTGEHEIGRRMLEHTAEGFILSDSRSWAAYGALHMRAAVFAAKDSRPQQAALHRGAAHPRGRLHRNSVRTCLGAHPPRNPGLGIGGPRPGPRCGVGLETTTGASRRTGLALLHRRGSRPWPPGAIRRRAGQPPRSMAAGTRAHSAQSPRTSALGPSPGDRRDQASGTVVRRYDRRQACSVMRRGSSSIESMTQSAYARTSRSSAHR